MTDIDHQTLEASARSLHPRSGRRLLGLGALLVLLGGLAIGVWRHYALHLEVMAAAEEHRDFVPSVRVAAVRASPGTMSVTLCPPPPAPSRPPISRRAPAAISKSAMAISAPR